MINRERERTTKYETERKNGVKSVKREEGVRIDQRKRSHKREKSSGRLESRKRRITEREQRTGNRRQRNRGNTETKEERKRT